ncbi:MAG: ribonuclease Z [Candidatus Pacearchaeota archaeon]
MKIPIYFLGTSHAIPTEKRNHTAIWLNYKAENILIDCGEGTQRQIRKMKLNPCSLTKILITHWHGDHILGLPGLLQTLVLNGYNKKLDIYGPKGTYNFLNLILKMFVFKGKINLEIHEVDEGIIINEKDYYIEAKRMKHATYCLAYSFIEKDKIRIDKEKLKKLKIKECKELAKLKEGKDIILNGKKVKASYLTYKEKGKKITFVLDSSFNNNMIEIAKNSNLLICEASYSKIDKEKAINYYHLTSEEAALIAKKAKCKRLILLHISQRYENKEKILLNEARKIFKETKLANDLEKIEI